MQMIHDACTPEMLELRRQLDQSSLRDVRPIVDEAAETALQLDERIRRRRDADAEARERTAWEARRAARV